MKISKQLQLVKGHVISSALVGCLLMSCNYDTESEDEDSNPLSINITEPVDRSWQEIKEEGVLRMITSYNSSTYFLYGGIERGFEYELVKKFADTHNLALEVVILQEGDNPYDLLNSGTGDLIAAGYTKTEERDKYVNFTKPYNLVDQIIVFNREYGNENATLEDLDDLTIAVRRNSSYYPRLKELSEQGKPLKMELVSDDLDTEAMLFAVSQGEYEATVADDHLYAAVQRYMDNLVAGPTISVNDTVSWAIRENNGRLKEEMDRFLLNHFRITKPDKPPKRSAFLNILRKRYYGQKNNFSRYNITAQSQQFAGVLSPYDELIKPIADSAEIDWLLLASIIAQESKFNPKSKSWAGAVGLMQIMPQYSEVESEQLLYEPEINIREGVRILKEHLEHYSYMDSVNCLKFALATYNSGMGHIADARRLAIDQNKNPNEWEHVSNALLKLMRRQYYKDARYGFARGIETVRYVREIVNRYETYKAILDLAERQNTTVSTAMIGS